MSEIDIELKLLILKYLSNIPNVDVRQRAINNTIEQIEYRNPVYKHGSITSTSKALFSAFSWWDSTEGYYYWETVCENLKERDETIR